MENIWIIFNEIWLWILYWPNEWKCLKILHSWQQSLQEKQWTNFELLVEMGEDKGEKWASGNLSYSSLYAAHSRWSINVCWMLEHWMLNSWSQWKLHTHVQQIYDLDHTHNKSTLEYHLQFISCESMTSDFTVLSCSCACSLVAGVTELPWITLQEL